MAELWFAHGKESGPWGLKITAMAKVAKRHGHTVVSPDFRFTMDPGERLDHLRRQSPPSGEALILAGSSMGGYVAAHAAEALQPRGVFLLAPALYLPGYPGEPRVTAAVIDVVHGWRDDLVPPAHSWRFAQACGAALHLLDAEHSLNTVIDDVVGLFDAFLTRCAR